MEHESNEKVRVGNHVVNLASISAVHFEREKLFVHLVGGRFFQLSGESAKRLWEAYLRGALDLSTGELVGGGE